MQEILPRITCPVWPIEQMTGYKPISTFWEDFWIANAFGNSAIRDTFRRAFREWKSDPVYTAELSLALNHLGWYYYEQTGDAAQARAKLYFQLWDACHSYARETFTGEDARTYWQITD